MHKFHLKHTLNLIPLNNLERPAQIFCYYTSWSMKRPGAGKFEPKDVDPSLCTHLVYAFATLKDHKLSEANDNDPDMYDQVLALREKNPDMQVLLGLLINT